MFAAHRSLNAALSHNAMGPALLARIINMVSLHRQRRKLATLDDALLSDIGISRADALREAARPFWDAPTHWHR